MSNVVTLNGGKDADMKLLQDALQRLGEVVKGMKGTYFVAVRTRDGGWIFQCDLINPLVPKFAALAAAEIDIASTIRAIQEAPEGA